MEHQQESDTQKYHEKTYQFDINIAQKYGVDEAIILSHLRHWIKVNRANGDNFHEGRTWTYNSVRAFAEIWPFWTAKHIRRTLNGLVTAGVLVKGNYNASGYDRTSWYAFADEKSWFLSREAIVQKRQMEGTKMGNGFAKSVQPIPNQSPNQSTDKSQPKDVGKSLSEKRPIGLVLAQDKAIAEGKKHLAETIIRLLPPVTEREKTTFRHILDYLVHGCETGKFDVEIFEQAVVWAQEAKADGIKPKKLFVHIMKEKTGFAKKGKTTVKKNHQDKLAAAS